MFWQLIIFTSNTLLTAIFIIEILSTLVFLLLIASALSSYTNASSLTTHSVFNMSLSNPLFQAIVFFFWISFLLSILLFIVLILFFSTLTSSDWFVSEFIFNFITNYVSTSNFSLLPLLWIFLLIGLFLKCGLAPFYFWKPYFFKNIPSWYLFFYILNFFFAKSSILNTLFIFLLIVSNSNSLFLNI
jgi:hypothetical protein